MLRWTSEARKTFNQNLDYLADEWNDQVINNFLDRVEEVFEQIKSNPELFLVYRKADQIYKCVVHKRIILYYKIVDHKYIDLLTFWNTSQDLDKLKL